MDCPKQTNYKHHWQGQKAAGVVKRLSDSKRGTEGPIWTFSTNNTEQKKYFQELGGTLKKTFNYIFSESWDDVMLI